MTPQELIDYCLTKPGAYLDCPFGPEPVCARIGERIFAEIFYARPWITLKCEPIYGLAFRERYPQQVRRGYHCPTPQHPYNNTVTLDGVIPSDTLREMIDHSYQRALGSLPKSKRDEAVRAHPQTESTEYSDSNVAANKPNIDTE